MAKNTTHKFWFLFVHTNGSFRDIFYVAVPIKDKDALQLVSRVRSALQVYFINATLSSYNAYQAYADMRDGIPLRPFSSAVALWREILDDYYTSDCLDHIFQGY